MKPLPAKIPPYAVGYWLLLVALAIWIMVIIGGATRLTGSGLSITEWKPIMGAMPPLDEGHWQEAFQKYQATPQFRISNPDMDVHGFKVIFFWEYLHRLWGRLLGVFFALPLAYFALRRQLTGPWLWRLGIALVLGGAQGFLGWFMVMSGLVDKPWVSPYRLTAHLLLALGLFSYVLWLALDIFRDNKSRDGERDCRGIGGKFPSWLEKEMPSLMGLLFLQIAWGGLMAGGKLALSYPTFPSFNGQWLPGGLLDFQSFWHHLFEHPAPVQLVHRILGILMVLALFSFFWRTRLLGWKGLLAWARFALLNLVGLQFLLGVATLIHSLGRVPVFLGVAHQATAVLLLAALLIVWHGTSSGLKFCKAISHE